MQTDPSKKQTGVEGTLQQQHGNASDVLQSHHRNVLVNHLISNQRGLHQVIRNGSTSVPSLNGGFNFPCFLPSQNLIGGEGPAVLLQHQPEPTSPSSATGSVSSSTFLMGMHNYTTLPSDLPQFVMEHQATLTFPEKVSSSVNAKLTLLLSQLTCLICLFRYLSLVLIIAHADADLRR
jgi:hypothetical protein